ncbi:MAG: SDR family oxidoreductase [Patescibacteria group bacterium]
MKASESLHGKVALVTGSSRGIGRAIVLALVRHGVKVGLLAPAFAKKELLAVKKEIEALQGQVLVIVADIRNERSMNKAVKRLTKKFGQVDILVNNAGVGCIDQVVNQKLDDFKKQMEVNFLGSVNCTLAVLPQMVKRKAGDIVNISSLTSLRGETNYAGYCASKAAVLRFGEGLFDELRAKGIRVMTICPGSVSTGSFSGSGKAPNAPSELIKLRVEDVADTLIHLVSLPRRATITEVHVEPTIKPVHRRS